MALDIPELRSLSGALRHFARYPSPRILAAQVLLAATVRLSYPEWSGGDLWILILIVLYWPLQEWFIHIHLLHLRPFNIGKRRIDPIVARMHRYHHRNPWEIPTVFLHWTVPAALFPVQLLFWFWVTPTAALAWSGILWFSAAALFYEWAHYFTHTPYQPSSRYFSAVQRNHRNHHFRNERRWHSFTAPILDEWLGTGGHPSQVPRSKTCMTLGIEEDVGTDTRPAFPDA